MLDKKKLKDTEKGKGIWFKKLKDVQNKLKKKCKDIDSRQNNVREIKKAYQSETNFSLKTLLKTL